MDDSDDPLAQPNQPLDAHGRTIDEAFAEELAGKSDLEIDWIHAKERHTGRLTPHGSHTPTPKAEPPAKVRPDPTTAAGKFRGKVAPQERAEPKAGARIYPRLKFRPNDPSNGGWGK